MVTLFAVCAAVGGTIFVCQFIMSLLGLAEAGQDVAGSVGAEGFDSDAGGVSADHGHDGSAVDHGTATHSHHQGPQVHVHGSSWFFGVLTFRTVVAAITFFGLAGLACNAGKVHAITGLGIAVVAGVAAMFVVHGLMKGMSNLRSEGTVHIQQAVGTSGEVYLRIPGRRSGVGKVTVNVQNRTMEYQAVTTGEALPTGARVVVTGVVDSDTVEVQPQSN